MRSPSDRVNGGETSGALQNLRQKTRTLWSKMQHDEQRGGKVFRKAANERLQSFNAAY